MQLRSADERDEMADLQVFTKYDSSHWLEQVLLRLRSESPAATLLRQKTAFDRIASPYENSLVLFGCGYLGRLVLQGLRTIGIEPIAYADNNPRLWGTRIDGLQVESPADAVAEHGHSACFVVTVFHGASVTEQLRAAGCDRIAPVVLLSWKYPDVFMPSTAYALPHWILEQESDIREAYALLCDDASRREFCEQILWRFQPGPGILSPGLPEPEMYFPDDLVKPLDSEVFVDCGAFNGDSARNFLAHRNDRFGRIFAIEPDPDNRADLQAWAGSLDKSIGSRITALPYGVSDRDERISFQATNTMGSSFLAGEGNSSIECRKLDTLFAAESPTYVKMDVEGVEAQALAGGAEVIRSKHPVLAICLYHRCDDLWQLPSLIHSIYPDYRLFLRRYAEDCWEIVCYAVPPGRLVHDYSGAAVIIT